MGERDRCTQHNTPEAGWRSSLWSRRFLPVCIGAYLVLGAAWATLVPLGQAPDEPGHFRYAAFLAQHGRLPDYYADSAGYESYQAPLYYTLAAAVGKLAGIGGEAPAEGGQAPPAALAASNDEIIARLPHYPTVRTGQHALALDALRQAARFTPAQRRAWLAMRLLTVLLGALGLFLGYRIVYLIFPDRPWLAATVAAALATHPMYTHISAAVGNDPPTVVAIGLTMLLALLILRNGPTPRRVALLGLAWGVGMLTKDSANVALPPALLALVWAAGRRREPEHADTILTDLARRVAAVDWAKVARAAGLALAVALAVGGWWYVRNTLLYGSPQHFPANVEKQVGWEIYLAQPEALWRVLRIAAPMTFRNLWAGFAWTNIAVAPALYWLLLIACLAALPGLLLLIGDACTGRLGWSLLQVRAFWLVLLTIALLKFAVLAYILTIDLGGGSQGRYLFPVLFGMVMVWALGVGRVAPERARNALPFVVGAALLAFNLYCLVGVVMPFYRAIGL